MSYVTIYKVQANGDVVSFAEGSNNHVFAPIVWETLGSKYHYLNKVAHPYFLVDPGLDALWKAWPDPKMSRREQVLLGASFDRVWIKRDLLPELIEACEWFLREHIRGRFDDRALAGDGADGGTFKRIGIIRALKEIYEDDLLSRGAAFNCCSAVASFWNVYDVAYSTEGHSKDEDCTVGEDSGCTVCGVTHGDPCDECGGRGFHRPACSEFEWDSRPWNIDRDKVQPRGEYSGKAAWELSEGLWCRTS